MQLVFLKQSLTANQIRKTPNIFLTISDKKLISLFFTQNEVSFFLSEVNDRNPIHHSKNIVIPACLIFERIVPLLPQDTSEISLHFVHPLYLGECQFIIRKREIALFQNNILCMKGRYR